MRLSIVTINKNNAEGLERTIRSVESQNRREFEYIVVDGGSDDDSLGVVGRHTGSLDRVIAEPDDGPYSAMNKGATIASGDYLLFLNSGDTLADTESLARLLPHLNGKDFYYSDAFFCRRQAQWVQAYPDRLDFRFFYEGTLNHQNTVVGRSFLSRFGFYDERFKIISDWAFMVKAFHESDPSYEHLPFIISRYELGGISGDRANGAKSTTEKKAFLLSLDPRVGEILGEYIEVVDGEYRRIRRSCRHPRALEKLESAYHLFLRVMIKLGL